MPTGNVQQIRATINPNPKSLLKKEVKRMLKAEVAKVAELANQNDQLQKGIDLTKRKLTSLKDDNCKLAEALQVKRKKARLTIAQLLNNIKRVIVEDNKEVKSTKGAAYAMVQMERDKREVMIRKERAHNSSVVAVCELNDIACAFVALSSSPRFHCCLLLPLVKKKHLQELDKIKSGYKAEARVSERWLLKKQEDWKHELLAAKATLGNEREKWQQKLCKLDINLSTANDRVYLEKVKQLQAIKEQVDETEQAVAVVQNYANSLEETNDHLRSKLKSAIMEKRAAFRLTNKAKKLVAQRLDKWHVEHTS